MQPAHPVERAVGIRYYVSDAPGVGGRLRDVPGDFRVREIEAIDPAPLDADPGAYPHVLIRVTLSDWETHTFAGVLSNNLGISRERIAWAGTKDKRAVSTQVFSVADADPTALRDVDLSGVELEIIGRIGRPMSPGDLVGNDFEIVVRDPERPNGAETVSADLAAFVDAGHAETDGPTAVGVPNYFGHQRFGSRRPVTHEVGLAIARGDWEGAVLAYVGNPSDREPETSQAARAFVEDTHDWAAALERMPTRLDFERAMLHRLVEGDDSKAAFRAALEAVPTTLQRLFVHAAQSYAFNLIVSERLERGLPFALPVAGDVVCFRDPDAPASRPVPDPDRTQRVTADRLATVRRHCERGRAFVTAPLVGSATSLGAGEPGEIERAVLSELGLSAADFDLPGEFGSRGTRRAVLVRTDLEIRREPLSFAFALPKGAYATVLLREYLKTDPASL